MPDADVRKQHRGGGASNAEIKLGLLHPRNQRSCACSTLTLRQLLFVTCRASVARTGPGRDHALPRRVAARLAHYLGPGFDQGVMPLDVTPSLAAA
eukprot:6805499-Prorocentrum_lima.AAC.1